MTMGGTGWVLNRLWGFRRPVNKFAPLRSRLRLGCRVFAATYRAATVRERLPEARFPKSVKRLYRRYRLGARRKSGDFRDEN